MMKIKSFLPGFLKAGKLIVGGMATAAMLSVQAFTPCLAPSETQSVPGNMLLALSVEFPTGLQVSETGTYDTTVTKYYDGYFDNKKCYSYDAANQVFVPHTMRTPVPGGHSGCATTSDWSGNVLNWLTMTNLDQFRSVMTGGTRDNFSDMNSTHPGDDNGVNSLDGRTVLIRSFSDRNSYNPVKQLRPSTVSGVRTGVPNAYSSWYVRSGGYGSKFFINSSNSFTDQSTADQKTKCTSAPDGSGTDCFNIRVQVCKYDTTGTFDNNGLESNCVKACDTVLNPGCTEPSRYVYYKPQGLIQEYSNSIRFGAMGYLNHSGQSRNGGVIRAQIKSVGATLIGEGGGANPGREWGGNGILVKNPDTADAAASAVTQSGVINYLNKFGYDSGYKGNDPVGELYYAAQRYFRNMSVPTDYYSGLTTDYKDGFPVITNFRDPIIQSCQKNFILGIGDIYTHCDGNLPGASTNTKGASYSTGTCGSNFPTDNSDVNVENLWNSIVSMEGGNSSWTGGSTQGTAFMAGLAWWANTNDIRPDLPDTPNKQTISTYWVDVLENNNGGSGIGAKSQYWLATKYGGFRQELLSNGSTNPNTLRKSWDKDASGTPGYGQPDTLFAGNTPTLLKTSLRAAFDDILARSQDNSASSAAVTSNRQTSTSEIIYAGYNPKDWTGSVSSCGPTQTAVQCQSSPIWEASRWFDTTYTAGATPKLNDTNRKIFTSWLSGSVFTEMPFRWTNLNTSQQSILNLNGTDSLGSQRVDYLRGSRANETSLFRTRGNALLGDVVNSNVTYLAGSGPSYWGTNFAGHTAYRAANVARPAVIYVGANDGMLHAFDASNGKELWGYIPGSVFSNLPALTNLSSSFSHKYYADGTAMVADTQTAAQSTATPSPSWRTMLVGGLGGGGRGYYALDISQQSSFSSMSESSLASIPMWEFTSSLDSDLGYTYNEPSVDPVSGAFKQIAKVADASTASGVWRVIVGNGYGSSANKAVLFFLDSETGAASTKLVASTSTSPDNGLSAPTPVDTDGDGLIDTVYAGDLQGKMHKFQFSKLNGSDYVVASSGDSSGVWRHIGVIYDAGMPITTAPTVSRACTGTSGWNVLFGTGKLNECADPTNSSTNAFYAVLDNNVSSALTVDSTLLATISYSASTITQGTVRTWTAPSLSNKKGWLMSLTGGERVISNPTIPPDSGAVVFASTKPSGNSCDPASAGYIMSVNICTAGMGNLTLIDTASNQIDSVGGIAVSASGILKISPTFTNTVNSQQLVSNQAPTQGAGNCTLPANGGGCGSTCTGTCVKGACSGGSGTCTDRCTNNMAIKCGGAPGGRYSWRELLSR